MPFTPQFGLPYPARSDAPDGPGQLEQLALAIESAVLGTRTLAERTANGATFTNTEASVDSIAASLTAGRRYLVVWVAYFSTTVANDRVALRIREDTGAGNNIQSLTATLAEASVAYTLRVETEYVAVANGSKTFFFTGQRTNGTGTITPQGSTTTQRVRMYVEQVAG